MTACARRDALASLDARRFEASVASRWAGARRASRNKPWAGARRASRNQSSPAPPKAVVMLSYMAFRTPRRAAGFCAYAGPGAAAGRAGAAGGAGGGAGAPGT